MKFLKYFTRTNHDPPVDRTQLITPGPRHTYDNPVPRASASGGETSERGDLVVRNEIRSKSRKDPCSKNHDKIGEPSDTGSGRPKKSRGETFMGYFARTAKDDPHADTTDLIKDNRNVVLNESATTGGVVLGASQESKKEKNETFRGYFSRASDDDPHSDTVNLVKDNHKVLQNEHATTVGVAVGANQESKKKKSETFQGYFSRTFDGDPHSDTVYLIVGNNDVVQHELNATEVAVLEADLRSGDSPVKGLRVLASGSSGSEPFLDSEESGNSRDDGDGPDCCVSSVEVMEVVEVDCVDEVVLDGEIAGKTKKKKHLRKKVRKRVWRVMRSSWKYLRLGFTGYAPGLAAMFTWGINTNMDKSGGRRA